MQARLFLIHKNRGSHKAGRLIVRLIHAANWVILGFLATGCTQNSMERHMAQELDVPMHEVCLGPYLVEVPAALGRDARQLDAGGDATFYFGQDENLTKLDVTVRDVAGEEAYVAAVDQRAATLAAQEHFTASVPMLVDRQSANRHLQMLQSYASIDTTMALRIELHALRGRSHVVLAETAFSEDAIDAVKARLLAFQGSLEAQDDAGTATGGYCIGDIRVGLRGDDEEGEFVYSGQVKGVPVTLRFDINTFGQPPEEPSLIRRGEANLEGLGVKPRRLRAGRVLVAGDPGEEWLGTFVEDGRRLHGFYAENTVQRAVPTAPRVLVRLTTGREEDPGGAPQMDDATAVALWDRIVPTIRRQAAAP